MSKGMILKRANQRPTLQYLKSDMMILIMNSWVMFKGQIMENMARQGKWRERDFVAYDAEGIIDEKTELFRQMCNEYEGNFRIAVCIAKHKPKSEWSPKPKRPDKPYKNFFDYVSKMKTALLERHQKYVFARKLQVGDVIPMYDGPYVVKEVEHDEETEHGHVVIYKEYMPDKLHTWRITWGHNVPKFYGITRRVDVVDNRRNFEIYEYVNTVNSVEGMIVNVEIDDVMRKEPSFSVHTAENDFAVGMLSGEIFGEGSDLADVKRYLNEKVGTTIYTHWDWIKFQWNVIGGFVDPTDFMDYCDGRIDMHVDHPLFIESSTPIPDWSE